MPSGETPGARAHPLPSARGNKLLERDGARVVFFFNRHGKVIEHRMLTTTSKKQTLKDSHGPHVLSMELAWCLPPDPQGSPPPATTSYLPASGDMGRADGGVGREGK